MLPDPVTFDASGYYWSTFSYDTSPNPWGSTAPLTGYDKYSIDLYVDFALTGLTFEGAPIPGPLGDYNNDYVVDAADYVVWRKTDGTPGNYDTWQANFGPAAGARATIGSAAINWVPEPATILILLVGILPLSLRYRILQP
jgi:hypothetical protein